MKITLSRGQRVSSFINEGTYGLIMFSGCRMAETKIAWILCRKGVGGVFLG